MKRSLILLFLCLFFSYYLSATVISVCASGCDYPMICDGIAGASSGDTLDLLDAIYTESQIWVGKNLTIQGQGPSATVVQAAATQAAAVDGVFTIRSGYTVRIRDLTIQNGKALRSVGNISGIGGGIRIFEDSQTDITIERVRIAHNWAESHGGGVYMDGSGANIRFIDCVISDNGTDLTNSSSGGGFYNRSSSQLTFTRCSIVRNRAARFGGGMYFGIFASNIKLINCTISDNRSGSGASSSALGGGLYIGINNLTNPVELINCTIVNNSLIGSTTRRGAGIYTKGGNITLTNTLIANNTGSTTHIGKDMYCIGSIPLTLTTSLIEDCFNCPVAPTYTSDPNLSSAEICDGQVYYVPQVPSAAIGGGTAPGGQIPTDDICGNIRLAGSYDLGSASSAAVLPVEMLSFSGKSHLNRHILSWETAQESNNLGFYPERSKDGQAWEKIGFVEGVGTSANATTYQFIDEQPLEGLNYYRLKQVDISGDFTYSSVIELRNTAEIDFSIYPNPAGDHIALSGISDKKGTIIIMDKWGRIVLENEVKNARIDVSVLPAGQYMLILDQGSMQSYRQLIKL